MAEELLISYRITPRTGQDIGRLARDIALEQTVEVPEDLVTSDWIRRSVVGRVQGIERLPGAEAYSVSIAYDPALGAGGVPQFLNLLFGNISLKDNISLVGLDLPPQAMELFPGPSHGIEGVRQRLGVFDRPLAATALKPMGASAEELAAIAGAFAAGGGDIVKDDHSLADHSFCPFAERVARCQEAVMRANSRTGANALYFPNICAPLEQLEGQIQRVVELGIQGVLVAPMLLGLDVVRSLAARRSLILMAHPALSGTHFHDPRHGIAPGVLLGTLFRLIGADISIFPNAGGRFGFSEADCAAIRDALRQELPGMRVALPALAGGMSLDRIPEMARTHGMDAVYLIGGALLRAGPRLEQVTRDFVGRIRRCFAAAADIDRSSGSRA